MWVARYKSGSLFCYENKPLKAKSAGFWFPKVGDEEMFVLKQIDFPDVKWEDDEPRELILKPTDKNIGEFSDGYHTFNELYEFRLLYNAAFFNELAKRNDIKLCKSRRHSDGKYCFGGGWFIVMAELPTGQISNHYEAKHWNMFHIPETDKAFEYDGHTPQDVMNRMRKFIENYESNIS